MAWPEPALFFVASTKTLSAFLSAGQCTFLLSWVCAHLCLCLVAFLCILHIHTNHHLCFSGQYTFLLLWVCARNSFCATVLARYFRLGGRPPGGRNLWRTFDVPNPRNNLPERRPPQPITRSAIAACECAALAQAIFTWVTKDFFFLACSSSFSWI